MIDFKMLHHKREKKKVIDNIFSLYIYVYIYILIKIYIEEKKKLTPSAALLSRVVEDDELSLTTFVLGCCVGVDILF